jgi:hypothetical protein
MRAATSTFSALWAPKAANLDNTILHSEPRLEGAVRNSPVAFQLANGDRPQPQQLKSAAQRRQSEVTARSDVDIALEIACDRLAKLRRGSRKDAARARQCGGGPWPMWPIMSCSAGTRSKTPATIRRRVCRAVPAEAPGADKSALPGAPRPQEQRNRPVVVPLTRAPGKPCRVTQRSSPTAAAAGFRRGKVTKPASRVGWARTASASS